MQEIGTSGLMSGDGKRDGLQSERAKVKLESPMPAAVIVDCLRTAVGKAGRGALRNTRPDDLAATVIRALLEKYPQVSKEDIEDVILGCAMPEGESGSN